MSKKSKKCRYCQSDISAKARICPNCGKKQGGRRKWFVLALAAVIVLAAAFGGGSDSEVQTEKKTDSNTEAKKISAEKKTEDSRKTAIEEQVLLDMDGVKITAKDYTTDTLLGEGVKLLIENTSEQDVGVGCTALMVNDYMVNNLFSETVAAGKSVNTTMELYSSELNAAGIETVGKIEVKFHLFNPESFETLKESDLAVIETSNIDQMDTTADIEGTEIMNEGGIKVVAKSVDENSFWGAAVVLYIENTSGKDIIVQCDDLSVNDFMITPYFSCEVYNGKKAVDSITLMSTELEENGIESVDKIEMKINVVDPDSFSTMKQTDPIVITNK